MPVQVRGGCAMRRFVSVLAIAFSVAVSLASFPEKPISRAPSAGSPDHQGPGADGFGVSRAVLRDGRLLIAGGRKAGQATAQAELVAADGTASPASSMRVARSGHASTVLADGRVLVTG